MKIAVQVATYWAALAISAVIDMGLLRLAHRVDHRVPALGFVAVVLLTVVLISPVALWHTHGAKNKWGAS